MKKYQKVIIPIIIAVVIAGIAGISIVSQNDTKPKASGQTEQSQEPAQSEKKDPSSDLPKEDGKTDAPKEEDKKTDGGAAADDPAATKPAASDKGKKTDSSQPAGKPNSTKPDTGKSSSKSENKTNSSNKGNSNSKPAASSHKHKWVNITATQKVWVPKIETVEVWKTHKVPKTGDIICNCGARFKNTDHKGHEQHAVDHILAGEPDNFWWDTVWVDEKIKVKEEVDNGHYENQTHVIGTFCETCGAVK